MRRRVIEEAEEGCCANSTGWYLQSLWLGFCIFWQQKQVQLDEQHLVSQWSAALEFLFIPFRTLQISNDICTTWCMNQCTSGKAPNLTVTWVNRVQKYIWINWNMFVLFLMPIARKGNWLLCGNYWENWITTNESQMHISVTDRYYRSSLYEKGDMYRRRQINSVDQVNFVRLNIMYWWLCSRCFWTAMVCPLVLNTHNAAS
jgi:hypothetical protein